MKIENILQLTAIDNKNNSTKNFYLGDWCSKYEDIINKSSRKEHHWQSDNKREKDGVWLVYDHNSKLRVKMFYENGIRKGKWEVYDKHGNIINERDYSKSN